MSDTGFKTDGRGRFINDIMEWKSIEGEEYNQHEARVRGHVVTIFSNRDGDDWGYHVDGGTSVSGFETRDLVTREALADLDQVRR